jgi:hypothetical protein
MPVPFKNDELLFIASMATWLAGVILNVPSGCSNTSFSSLPLGVIFFIVESLLILESDPLSFILLEDHI